jgi:hypothetical protein
MKSYFFLLVTFLFLPITKAQVNPTSKKDATISIGLVQSVNVCYRFSSSTPDLMWMKESLDSIETPLLSNSTAVIVNIVLNKRLQLNTGVIHSKIGYQYKEGSLAGFTTYKEAYNLIELPIQLVYKLGAKKSFPFISLGAAPGYIYSIEAKYVLDNQKEESSMKISSDISKFQVNASIGFGASVKLSNSWNFKSELFYNQYLLSPSSGLVKKYLFSTGISVGLFKSF